MTRDLAALGLAPTTPGPLAPSALGTVFLPYQQRLLAAVLANRVTVVEKSRRTGYSWAAGAIAALIASSQRQAAGQDVLYMGYEKEMTREFIGYVAEWARAFQLAASAVEEFVWRDPDRPEQDIGAFRVKFASGFEVVALPSVPRALRGKQGFVILDEAAFMDDLREVLKAALALLIWGGKVLVVSTHNGETNPFNELVTEIRAGKKPYALLRCTLDDALADGLYARVCQQRGITWSADAEARWREELIAEYGDGADEELFAIPSPTSGTWLPLPLIEARQDPEIPVLRWTAPEGFSTWREDLRAVEVRDWLEQHVAPLLRGLDGRTPHALGQDFARKSDLSVLWPLAIGANLVRRTPFVIELANMPFSQQQQVLFFICDRLPLKRGIALDATGNGMSHAEAAADRYGSLVLQVMLTEPWYREHTPPLKAAFEDATITIPRDRGIADDFRLVKLVRGVARVVERVRTERGARHGDAFVAAVLALFAARTEPDLYEYQAAVPARRGTSGGAHDEELADEMNEGRPRRTRWVA